MRLNSTRLAPFALIWFAATHKLRAPFFVSAHRWIFDGSDHLALQSLRFEAVGKHFHSTWYAKSTLILERVGTLTSFARERLKRQELRALSHTLQQPASRAPKSPNFELLISTLCSLKCPQSDRLQPLRMFCSPASNGFYCKGTQRIDYSPRWAAPRSDCFLRIFVPELRKLFTHTLHEKLSFWRRLWWSKCSKI